jgi:hypothetical protein
MQEAPEQMQQPLRRSGREGQQPAQFADYIPHQLIAFKALMEPQVENDEVKL